MKKSVLFGVVALFIGIAIGATFFASLETPNLAYGKDIEQARKDITAKYLAESATDCNGEFDSVPQEERLVTFYKYLRVNNYADRAVVRGCNDIDSLLVKNKAGEWVKTNVNVSLDLRANPRWISACKVKDLLVADDVTRSENSSIDEMNYEECIRLDD